MVQVFLARSVSVAHYLTQRNLLLSPSLTSFSHIQKMALKTGFPYAVKIENDFSTPEYDGIILISKKGAVDGPSPITKAVSKAIKINKAAEDEGGVFEVSLPAERLIYVPVQINLDASDVRSFGEGAKKGLLAALKAGVKKPLVMLPTFNEFPYCQLVSVLGLFEALYVNLQYREQRPHVFPKIEQIGLFSAKSSKIQRVIDTAIALENGRYVARDIGGSDPERMTAIKTEEYVQVAFQNTPVKVEVISDLKTLEKEFPLWAAVNRAANEIERHRGRVIILTYESGSPEQTLFLVGKGITYDTGGADIKAGGVMAGMCRDKCGAAAVGGFMKVLAELKPNNIKVVGIMSMARNSVGENCYVADEMIQARAGVRVRVGNTDAEGRMIMADPLCYAKEQALKAVNPHLITIATLTGHAFMTVGNGYSIVMDNAVARKNQNDINLQKCAEQIGDPFEISVIRREDLAFHKGKVDGEDVYQANNQPSVRTPRGHQGPAGFLILASGLDKHGLESEHPIKYSHIDIAGSAGDVPHDATGSPILALYSRFLNSHFSDLCDD